MSKTFPVLSSGLVIPRDAIAYGRVEAEVVNVQRVFVPNTSREVFEIGQHYVVNFRSILSVNRSFFSAKKSGLVDFDYMRSSVDTSPRRSPLLTSESAMAVYIAEHFPEDADKGEKQLKIRIDRILQYLERAELIDLAKANGGADVSNPEADIEVESSKSSELTISEDDTAKHNDRIAWIISKFNTEAVIRLTDGDEDEAEEVSDNSVEALAKRNVLSDVFEIIGAEAFNSNKIGSIYSGMLSSMSEQLSGS